MSLHELNASPGPGPSHRGQFWIVLLLTLGLASAASWLTAEWLGFRFTSMSPFDYGAKDSPTRVFAASSSLGYFGLDWNEIATEHDWSIRRYDIPGASPCEFEQTQDLVPNATVSILVISTFDMDESYFSDFRAAMVPMGRTIQDLMESHSEWSFTKRTLSQYPEHWIKAIFPTACSSMGVMVGFRAKLAELHSGHGNAGDSDKAVLNGTNTIFPTARISDWDQGRFLRNSSGLIASAQGGHFFHGPKHNSLRRVLAKARDRGAVFVVVMPVSSSYQRLVINKRAAADFEASLANLARDFPDTKWVRLDQVKGLTDDNYFWDLMHLNVYGREIATRELEKSLPKPMPGK